MGRACGREDASDVDLGEAGRGDRRGGGWARRRDEETPVHGLAQRMGNLPEILAQAH
jgi:hypothetical protein